MGKKLNIVLTIFHFSLSNVYLEDTAISLNLKNYYYEIGTSMKNIGWKLWDISQ